MAEVLASMVLRPLVSMVKEKASSYLLDQYKVMEGMEKQHKLLKLKLPAILDVITDAEEQAAAKREGAKVWLEEVRKVAYQANDVLDEFKYEALRRKAKKEGHYKALGMDVIKLFPSHNRIVFRHKMANKLQMILQEIDVLIAQMIAFRFKFKPGPLEPINYLRQSNSDIIDPLNIAKESRAQEKKDVIDRLLAQASSPDLMVLPIVGMGGLGKTTLAQLIYNDPEIRKHFQLQLWVCVSNNFDVDSVADRIVKENGCLASGSSALKKLQNAVSGKRYLLVLDDVWNRDEHKWERLKSYIQHGDNGSAVLTTTRDGAVADIMMGKTEGAYKLERLGACFIEKIIKTRAFRSQKEEELPVELVKMVGEVAKRCAGSPLPAISLGSLLRTKTTEEEWKYLDLSESDIEALPEDISILYHLQTLNLSDCRDLQRLPKELKYLTSLRHLYTHKCPKLKSMPAELGHLTCLQTLTCFVVGTDTYCSNVRELRNLDLGGRLELRQLENVARADVEAIGLGNKKKLTELKLVWIDNDQQEQNNNNHEEVVEGLKPHDGLKALRIDSCGSSIFPSWMNMLNGMVKLKLFYCRKLEKLPALWQLPVLEILHLEGLPSLHCLCSGGTTPITFQKLRVLTFEWMPNFEAWLDTDAVQGEGPIFPKVEELEIRWCGGLTALPKAAPVITESSGGVDTKCRSAFPELRKMKLTHLNMFDRWEAVEGTLGEGVTFPRLEELYIRNCASLSALPKGSLLVKQSFGGAETVCPRSAFTALRKLHVWFCGSLSALPKGSLLVKQSFGGAETVCCRSAFPALRKLLLHDLSALERWGAAEGTPGEEVTFPLLEKLDIDDCPKLTDLPEAPKLSELGIKGRHQYVSLQAASRYIPSLSMLRLDVSPDDAETTLQHVKQKWNHELPLEAMRLARCDLLFSSHSNALALWACFARLVDLSISDCDALVYWPENVFQVLVSLRKLWIRECSKLTGRTQASGEQSAPGRDGLLPHLEFLTIDDCKSFVEVPNLPASLKKLHIERCNDNLESIVFGLQEDTRLARGEGVVQLDTSSSIPGSSSREATTSTTVLKLESLDIWHCYGLSKVANLPPSIKTLGIYYCGNLQSLSGQLGDIQILTIHSCSRLESLDSCLGELRSLEELELYGCKSLVSLPDGPQAYSSLRILGIRHCDGVKSLPPSLQSRLGCLEQEVLDARYEGWSMRRLVNKAATRLFPCSRDEESDSD
ncbi:hypothetical protein PVAP13_2KG085100 [Panicum virgatum]|uniref:Uncharacterized protein n=1 Tax=Panicum virgatum TaxID=38727 RepID=A0A8T0W4P9_PANVG|nr:hypothetical protein PVAP13_2KG085100 [Panicum virgatum]